MRSLKPAVMALVAVALILGVVLLPGCGGGQQPSYKIGAVLAVTGFNAPLGLPEKQTLEMVQAQINAAGGIQGHPLEIVIYDTESDATKALTLTKKLLEQDKVLAVIGSTASGETMAIIPTMTQAQTPLISLAAADEIVVPVAERYWIFKTPQPNSMVAGRLYDYVKQQGTTKVATFTASGGFGVLGKKALETVAAEKGITIVAAESFGDTDTDMTPQLTRLRSTGAQAIIVWGTNPGPALISKQAKGLGITIPIYNSHGIADPTFIDLAGDAANGVIFPAGKLTVPLDNLAATDPQKAVLAKFQADFQAKYGKAPNTYAGHAWDAVMMIAKALEKSGADKAKLRDEIEKTTNFAGTSGVFTMSAQDHVGLKADCLALIKIVNGKWEPITK